MMLPAQEIKRLIRETELLSNVSLLECLGPASYDLRIGTCLMPGGKRQTTLKPRVPVTLPPQGYALFGTLEEINMPDDLAGMVMLRSTYGRRGVVSWFQGFVDPGYSGKLTLVLHNFSARDLILRYGERVAQLSFLKLSNPTALLYVGSYGNLAGRSGARKR